MYVESIQYGNEALKFIDRRLLDDKYRGSESSEHNRYDVEEIFQTLTILNKFAPNKTLLRIRNADLSKRPFNYDEEKQYALFCEEVKSIVGKGTQDSIRKNIFVDVHRMGFIERFKENKEGIFPTDPDKHNPIKYIALTDDGIKFVNSSLIDRPFIFTKGLYKLLGNHIDISLNILKDSDYEIDNISRWEFMFFVSAIDTDTTFSISATECIKLLKSYRALTAIQQKKVIETLKQRLKPDYFEGDKTQKRDWHNWKNKIDQIFHLFAQTAYFEVNNDVLSLTSRKLKNNKGVDIELKKRSQTAKTDYFRQHNINSKVNGYELHHVIALAFSESPEQYELLDKWENLVYIDAGQHAKITQNSNKNIIMSAQDYDIVLQDYTNRNTIYLEYNNNIIYNADNQHIMLSYNDKLLNLIWDCGDRKE